MTETPKKKSTQKRTKPGSKDAEPKGAASKDTEKATKPGAYLVLARKYRPRDFAELIGQDAMVQTLSNAFASGRIAQAYMLSGVRGVGKTTTARILARALNYETDKIKEPTIEMQAEGDHCRAIMEGTHVDVIEMDAASHTGIDDIREIIEAARYKPVAGRYKVYIIDEVHMLSKSAFNGLLKTLEEPPAHVKFIFATTELRKVPVTVLSRCQRFDLRRITIETLETHFTGIAKLEKVKIDKDAITLIAQAAEGSVRDGLSLLDQAFARGSSGAITIKEVRDMLGLAEETEIYSLLQAIFKGEAEQAISSFRAFYAKGGDSQQIIAELAAAVHAITCHKALADGGENQNQPEAVAPAIEDMAGTLSHAVLHRAWQALLKGYDEVGTAPSQQSAAEMLLLRLIYMGDLPNPGDIVKAIRTLKDSGGAIPARKKEEASTKNTPEALIAHAPEPRTSTKGNQGLSLIYEEQEQQAPANQPRIHAEVAEAAAPIVERFADILDLITEKRDVKLKLQLEEYAELVNFAPGRIELHMLEGADDRFISDLSNKLSSWTGTRWMVALSHERGAPTIASQRRLREQKELEQVKSHPVVEATLKTFPGAEITDIKPIKSDDETGGTKD